MRVAAVAMAAWLAASSAGARPVGGADVIRTEPGPTPTPEVPPPQAPAAAALLTYGPLALSGLAVVLGGAAVAVALAGRRRADEVAGELRVRPSAALDPRSADRLSRLEAAVRDLAAAPAPPRGPAPAAAPASAPREPFPPPAPAASPRAGASSSATAAAPASVAPAERLSAWVDELRRRFAKLALDPSSSAAGFIADHAPRGALAGPEGVALLDGFEGAKLWAVRAPGEAEVWALTPGEQAVLNWSAHFAPQRTQVAAEVFGEAFDLVEGGAGLRLEEPALVRRDVSGRLSVRRRGRLSGFRG